MMALRTAATGMAAQDLNVDVISNNIANMNTIGYKKQRAEFEDLLYQDIQRPGAQSSDTGTIVPTGIQIGAGVTAGSVYRITTQGSPTQTGNQYDLAISGKGFFQVLLPSGEIAYTRAGNFTPNASGQLVTQDGYQVQPQITIPQGTTAVTISPSGQVQATIPGQTTPTVVGQLTMATFVNEAGLEATGNNLFLGPAHGRQSERKRGRAPDPGQHRILERRSGDRDHGPDRGSAGLRDEFQGHHLGRPDALHRQQHEAVE
jgi:flagellar basal-body rod protein FlgG